jgi:hypothetical protein
MKQKVAFPRINDKNTIVKISDFTSFLQLF